MGPKRVTRLPNSILVVVMFGLFCIVPQAFAQFSSNVQGDVQDASGAVIARATVNLVETDTHVTRTATTDGAGAFRFVSIAPGPYQIEVSAPGFKTTSVTFTLQTAENRQITLTLPVGQSSTSVQVSAEAPLLDTSDSRLQDTINAQELESLPLEGRNPTSVIGLTPGVTGLGTGGATTFFTENAGFSANGRGTNGNQYILDGLDINIDVNPGVLTLVPNADAVSEISVQTNTYTVDYNKTSSMQTVMTTKAGTDQYHGFGSIYYTYQGLQAKGEFFPANTSIKPFHQTNMSFGIGGPVIPKKQFFFFFAIEPYRALYANGNNVITYEDPAFVSFAQAVQPNSPEVQLLAKYRPTGATTTNVASTAQDVFGPQNLAGNTGCDTPATDNIPCSTPIFDNGIFNSSSWNNAKQYDVRIDKYFAKDRLYGTVFRDTTNSGGPAIRPAFNTTSPAEVIAVQGNETHTFSANLLNEVFFGYNYLQGKGGVAGSSSVYTVPSVSVNSLGVGWGIGFPDSEYGEHNYHWRDQITHLHGTHTLSVGFEGWHGDDLALFAPSYSLPAFHFNSMIDLINNNPYSEGGLSYNPVTGQPMPGQYEYAETTFGIFAQDSWRIGRRLTVNYGIRYDNYGNPYPKDGTPLANFHLGSGSTMDEQVRNGVITQQDHVYNHDMNWIFSPRAGVAWDPDGSGRWVVRGGYGIYRDWVTLGNSENNLKGNPPGFVIPTFFNNGSTAVPIFGFGTSNSYPYGFTYPAFKGTPLNAAGGIEGAQISVGGVDGKLKSPYTETWSASVAHELSKGMTASASYVGQHSGDLLYGGGNSFGNAFSADVNVYAGDLLQHLTCTPVTPSNGQQATCFGTQTRLNSSFGAINYTFNSARSNYSALILALRGRFGSRGFVEASYTRSASKDDSGNYKIEYPMSRWYSPSPWDVPNRFSLGGSYQLPSSHAGAALLGRLVSGWQLSPTIVAQTGNPYTVWTGASLDVAKDASGKLYYLPDSGNFNADGDNGDFPNVSSYHTPTSRTSYKNGVFTHCQGTNLDQCGQFSFPQVGQEGDEKINAFRNPGFFEVDGTLKKITRIREGMNLELWGELFNVFNRVNLNGVDTNAQDGLNFGKSTSTQIPRVGALGAKITF